LEQLEIARHNLKIADFMREDHNRAKEKTSVDTLHDEDDYICAYQIPASIDEPFKPRDANQTPKPVRVP
jgi:LPS O-antigen subunit length determinant protein (WzzB/FepE family)